MPPKSRVSPFGPEFEQLLMAAFAGAPYRFPLPTPGHARIMKMRILAYFRALREEDIRLDLVEMADNLLLKLEPDSATIVFIHKIDAWENEQIRAHLQLPKGFEHGVALAPGSELLIPDLTGTKLKKRLDEVRVRNASGQSVTSAKK